MSEMSFENHIMTQFDEELEEIRTRLMEMGGKVEQQLQNAVRAVTEGDSALAEDVIKEERLVDEMEVDIDVASAPEPLQLPFESSSSAVLLPPDRRG